MGLPFSGFTEFTDPPSAEITLVSGMQGYKISLRGLQVICHPAATVTSPATISIGGIARFNPNKGGPEGGQFQTILTPSTTEYLYFNYAFPEGCVETVGVRAGDPINEALNLIFGYGSSGSDTLTASVNYWGQYVPYEG